MTRPPGEGSRTLRLLHTADWHLGQSFHGFGRSHEHGCFLNWLSDQIAAQHADALIIAGDVFDVLNPPVAAQAALFRFLATARQRRPHLTTVIIAGNHDSGSRLEAPAPLLTALGVTVVGTWPRTADGRPDPDRLAIPLRHADGTIGGWCVALPFLRATELVPGAAAAVAGEEKKEKREEETRKEQTDETQEEPPLAGLRHAWNSAFAAAFARAGPGEAVIAAAHCHVSGGVVSELSERRVLIGSLEALPADLFPPTLAYVALGHLHRAQTVSAGGSDRLPSLRYCGSPIPLALDEARYPHQVVRVDLTKGRPAEVTPLPVPRVVEILRLPGPAGAPLPEVLTVLRSLPAADDSPQETWPWLEVTVRVEGPSTTLRAEVEAALLGRRARLVRLSARQPDSADSGPGLSTTTDLATLDPEEIFRQCHHQACGVDPSPMLVDAFRSLLAAAVAAPAQDS